MSMSHKHKRGWNIAEKKKREREKMRITRGTQKKKISTSAPSCVDWMPTWPDMRWGGRRAPCAHRSARWHLWENSCRTEEHSPPPTPPTQTPTFLANISYPSPPGPVLYLRRTRTKRSERIAPVLKTSHGLPVSYRTGFKVLLPVKKSLNSLGPEYIN